VELVIKPLAVVEFPAVMLVFLTPVVSPLHVFTVPALVFPLALLIPLPIPIDTLVDLHLNGDVFAMLYRPALVLVVVAELPEFIHERLILALVVEGALFPDVGDVVLAINTPLDLEFLGELEAVGF